MIVDALSQLPDIDSLDAALPTDPNDILLAAILSISSDDTILKTIWEGYFCIKLKKSPTSCLGLTIVNGLLYMSRHLVIPQHGNVQQTLFLLAHDSLGHFSFEKSYGSLRGAYYWPNMCKDLEEAYIPLCRVCQWNKSTTKKPVGPLHPMPVPDE